MGISLVFQDIYWYRTTLDLKFKLHNYLFFNLKNFVNNKSVVLKYAHGLINSICYLHFQTCKGFNAINKHYKFV